MPGSIACHRKQSHLQFVLLRAGAGVLLNISANLTIYSLESRCGRSRAAQGFERLLAGPVSLQQRVEKGIGLVTQLSD